MSSSAAWELNPVLAAGLAVPMPPPQGAAHPPDVAEGTAAQLLPPSRAHASQPPPPAAESRRPPSLPPGQRSAHVSAAAPPPAPPRSRDPLTATRAWQQRTAADARVAAMAATAEAERKAQVSRVLQMHEERMAAVTSVERARAGAEAPLPPLPQTPRAQHPLPQQAMAWVTAHAKDVTAAVVVLIMAMLLVSVRAPWVVTSDGPTKRRINLGALLLTCLATYAVVSALPAGLSKLADAASSPMAAARASRRPQDRTQAQRSPRRSPRRSERGTTH